MMTRNEPLRVLRTEEDPDPEQRMRTQLRVVARGRTTGQVQAGAFLDRIPVRLGGRIRMVEVERIDYIEAQGNYVRLHAGGNSFLVRESLANLESKLDPRLFLRIHRSRIVRLDRVAEMEPLLQGEYRMRLRSGVVVRSSRRYRPQIKAALAIQ
jgi:two-component system, LytTR family, response regulator